MPGRRNLFGNLKYKAQTAMSRFLYEERGSGYGSGAYMDEEPPYEAEEKPRRGRRNTQQRAVEEQPQEQSWQAPYQGMYQQQPVQPMYQQQPQPQPQQQPQPMTQFAAQIEEQRSRAKQDNPNVVPFPGTYTGEQNPQEQTQSGQSGICVLNLRNNAECRLAISMLRQGNALMVIMENVGDAAEMRRYVDTLSGACFSLNATITKVSRHGAYLLAPGSFSVMADAATSQMNSIQRRPQQAAQYTQPRAANPYAPQANAYPSSYQNPTDENGFEYRNPAPEPQQTAMYYQQPAQAPAMPSFDVPRPGTGYVPDRMEAVN
ncbi:MAG: cell division protein SepF [Clostridia bacterium]|nr:cell division protein SepF [Clostridia bacterium]